MLIHDFAYLIWRWDFTKDKYWLGSTNLDSVVLNQRPSSDAPFFHLTDPLLYLVPPFRGENNGTLTSKTRATCGTYFMSELFCTKALREKERVREREDRHRYSNLGFCGSLNHSESSSRERTRRCIFRRTARGCLSNDMQYLSRNRIKRTIREVEVRTVPLILFSLTR